MQWVKKKQNKLLNARKGKTKKAVSFDKVNGEKNRYDEMKRLIKKCHTKEWRQFMQGEKIFKEGQRLTPVFEMHREKRESCEKKTNNNFYWSYCCQLYAQFSYPYISTRFVLYAFRHIPSLHYPSSSTSTLSIATPHNVPLCPFVQSASQCLQRFIW